LDHALAHPLDLRLGTTEDGRVRGRHVKNFQQSPTPTSEPQNSRKRTLRGNSVGSRSHDNAIQKYGRPLLSILSTLVDIALIISFASIIVFPSRKLRSGCAGALFPGTPVQTASLL
jgi:hypothetical protein